MCATKELTVAFISLSPIFPLVLAVEVLRGRTCIAEVYIGYRRAVFNGYRRWRRARLEPTFLRDFTHSVGAVCEVAKGVVAVCISHFGFYYLFIFPKTPLKSTPPVKALRPRSRSVI